MKLSSKSKYGIVAMIDLGLAYEQQDQYVVLKTIAQKRNISEAYLERLLAKLKKANLVTAQRGSLGGYRLTKSPKEITLTEILNTLEDSLNVCDCKGKEDTCLSYDSCVPRFISGEIDDKISEFIDSKTLESLMSVYSEKKGIEK